MRAPTGIHTTVWHVVCLSALLAMDAGRKSMFKNTRPNAVPPAGGVVHAARRCAVARFWDLLHDFSELSPTSQWWYDAVPLHHPFLRPQPPQQPQQPQQFGVIIDTENGDSSGGGQPPPPQLHVPVPLRLIVNRVSLPLS